MKISRERIEQVREGRTDRLAPFFTLPMIGDLLTAIDERDELLAKFRDELEDEHPMKELPGCLWCKQIAEVNEFLRGTKWENANG